MNCTRLVFLSNTSKHNSTALGSNKLRVHNTFIVTDKFFSVSTEFAIFVATHSALLNFTDTLVTTSSIHKR